MSKKNMKLEFVEPITPETVGDPDMAADLSIDQSHLEEYVSSPEGDAAAVECRRPPRGIFFTVRKEKGKPWKDRAFYWQLEIAGKDPYLVAPAIAKLKEEAEDTIRPVLLVRYVTMAGEEALWPLKLDLDGRSNSYNTSAMNVLSIAEDGSKEHGNFGEGAWVRILSASRHQGRNKHYRYQVSKKKFSATPPRFSNRTFKELVDICFKGKIITSVNHEIWRELEEGSTK